MLKQKIFFEIVGIAFSLLLCLVLFYPFLNWVQEYPYTYLTIIYIFTFSTLTRYIFFFKFGWFAKSEVVKLIMIFLSAPFIFYLISQLNGFQTYLDEKGLFPFLDELDPSVSFELITYIRKIVIFFGVGSVICALIWPIRLIVSIWRVRNKGGV